MADTEDPLGMLDDAMPQGQGQRGGLLQGPSTSTDVASLGLLQGLLGLAGKQSTADSRPTRSTNIDPIAMARGIAGLERESPIYAPSSHGVRFLFPGGSPVPVQNQDRRQLLDQLSKQALIANVLDAVVGAGRGGRQPKRNGPFANVENEVQQPNVLDLLLGAIIGKRLQTGEGIPQIAGPPGE